MANTSTQKRFESVKTESADSTRAPKTANYRTQGKGENSGQMRGNAQMDKFADPMNAGVVAPIGGMDRLYNDIGEMSGFITDGYLDKQDTPYGEAAKFNFLPPGMDISNQENAEIHTMKLVRLTAESYPGDGWSPAPRDIVE